MDLNTSTEGREQTLRNCDVCLTMMFRKELSGHFYECFEYYMLLKDHFKTLVFLVHEYDRSIFLKAIEDKYDLTKEELFEFNRDLIVLKPLEFFANKICRQVTSKLFFYVELLDYEEVLYSNQVIVTDHIGGFRCEPKLEKLESQSRKIHILQDYRIYGDNFFRHHTYNYVKKILFNRFTTIKRKNIGEVAWIYMPPGAREQSEEYVWSVINKYNFKRYILLSDVKINNSRVKCYDKHVPFVFEKFDVYIYGPVLRRFDCSSRIITESSYFGKGIILNIDYREEDTGLHQRLLDIESDIGSLRLNKDDEIVDIIRGIINVEKENDNVFTV